jgi:hypothetical protein
MPKKPSTQMVMLNYSAFSSRRVYRLRVEAIEIAKRGAVRFELAVIGDPRQAGRLLNHDLPAILAPNSPLARFLDEAFGIRVAENETLDLATLRGREFEARFAKHVEGAEQAIVAVRPIGRPHNPAEPTGTTRENEE